MCNEQTSEGMERYLGYPCSVNAGIDPVQELNRHQTEYPEFQRKIRKLFCGILNLDDDSIGDDELDKEAQRLRDQWDYAPAQDHTMMHQDCTEIKEYIRALLIPEFLMHGTNNWLTVINEVDDEHINDISGFLTDVGQTVRFLYLSGHGLPESVALCLADCPADDKTKRSAVWCWDLRRCFETMGKEPSEITKEAQKGDLVVFSSGFLTPEWVVDRIKESEEHKKYNTVIIVIDACFSGCWQTRIVTKLQSCKLRYARILVQTSCSCDEVSYGGFFTPLFC